MNLQDHSDASWLVYADWLEENGRLQEANQVRHEIENAGDNWEYEYRGVGVVGVGGGVGSIGVGSVGSVGVSSGGSVGG